MDSADEMANSGRVTRSLRKRLNSIEFESTSRPNTPTATLKLSQITETPSTPTRATRRNSVNTPINTPSRSGRVDTPDVSNPSRRITRRNSLFHEDESISTGVAAKPQFAALTEVEDEKTPPPSNVVKRGRPKRKVVNEETANGLELGDDKLAEQDIDRKFIESTSTHSDSNNQLETKSKLLINEIIEINDSTDELTLAADNVANPLKIKNATADNTQTSNAEIPVSPKELVIVKLPKLTPDVVARLTKKAVDFDSNISELSPQNSAYPKTPFTKKTRSIAANNPNKSGENGVHTSPSQEASTFILGGVSAGPEPYVKQPNEAKTDNAVEAVRDVSPDRSVLRSGKVYSPPSKGEEFLKESEIVGKLVASVVADMEKSKQKDDNTQSMSSESIPMNLSSKSVSMTQPTIIALSSGVEEPLKSPYPKSWSRGVAVSTDNNTKIDTIETAFATQNTHISDSTKSTSPHIPQIENISVERNMFTTHNSYGNNVVEPMDVDEVEDEDEETTRNLICEEASQAPLDYQSEDSLNSEDRENEKENEFLSRGTSIDSADTDDENECEESDDSFIASDTEDVGELNYSDDDKGIQPNVKQYKRIKAPVDDSDEECEALIKDIDNSSRSHLGNRKTVSMDTEKSEDIKESAPIGIERSQQQGDKQAVSLDLPKNSNSSRMNGSQLNESDDTAEHQSTEKESSTAPLMTAKRQSVSWTESLKEAIVTSDDGSDNEDGLPVSQNLSRERALIYSSETSSSSEDDSNIQSLDAASNLSGMSNFDLQNRRSNLATEIKAFDQRRRTFSTEEKLENNSSSSPKKKSVSAKNSVELNSSKAENISSDIKKNKKSLNLITFQNDSNNLLNNANILSFDNKNRHDDTPKQNIVNKERSKFISLDHSVAKESIKVPAISINTDEMPMANIERKSEGNSITNVSQKYDLDNHSPRDHDFAFKDIQHNEPLKQPSSNDKDVIPEPSSQICEKTENSPKTNKSLNESVSINPNIEDEENNKKIEIDSECFDQIENVINNYTDSNISKDMEVDNVDDTNEDVNAKILDDDNGSDENDDVKEDTDDEVERAMKQKSIRKAGLSVSFGPTETQCFKGPKRTHSSYTIGVHLSSPDGNTSTTDSPDSDRNMSMGDINERQKIDSDEEEHLRRLIYTQKFSHGVTQCKRKSLGISAMAATTTSKPNRPSLPYIGELNPSQSFTETITERMRALKEERDMQHDANNNGRLSKSCSGAMDIPTVQSSNVENTDKLCTTTGTNVTTSTPYAKHMHTHKILNRCEEILQAANEAKLQLKIAKKNTLLKRIKNKSKKDVLNLDFVGEDQMNSDTGSSDDVTSEVIVKALKASEEVLFNRQDKQKQIHSTKSENWENITQPVQKALKASDEILDCHGEDKKVPTEIAQMSTKKRKKIDMPPSFNGGKVAKKRPSGDLFGDKDKIPNKREKGCSDDSEPKLISSAVGNFVETPLTPKRKIKKFKLPSGIVTVEPVTPKSKNSALRFYESPITPSIALKVNRLEYAVDQPPKQASQEFPRKKRKHHVEERQLVFPKSQRTQSGVFVEEKLAVAKRTTVGASQFQFSSLVSNGGGIQKKKKKQQQPVAISSFSTAALNFKENAIQHSNAPRVTSRDLLQHKERTQKHRFQ